MSEKITSNTIFFPGADVKLITGLQAFWVSSKAVGLVCRPWEAMVNWPSTKEVQENHVEPREICMEDDDPAALEILLNITHLRFEAVPRSLDFEQLLSLAILTDKYQATRILRPWINDWTMDLRRFIGKPGYEEWAWMAWEFGLEVEFERITTHLVLNAKVGDGGSHLVDDEHLEGKQLPSGLIG